jgi:tetratricopeptide (TPR) repeat protein
VFFPNPGVGFSWPLFVKSLFNLGMFWRYHVPVFHYHVWFLGGVFILLVVLLYHRKQYFLTGVSLITGILFLYTLGMSKAYDGSESVFFSRARNYLGIPFLLGLMIYWISQSINVTKDRLGKRWMYLVLVVFVFLNIIIKYQDYDAHFKKIFDTPGGLPGEYISYIEEVSQAVEKAARTYGAELVIFPDGNRTLNYGCAAKLNGKVATLLAGYERRTWRIEEEENQLRGNILLYGFDQHVADEWASKTGKKARQVHQSPNLILVESGPTLVIPFLHEINMPIRSIRLARLYYRRGLLQERTANFTEAIADYSRAIDHKSNFSEAYYHRAMVYLVQGESRKAIDDFSSILGLHSDNHKALLGRAMAYEKNGNYQEAQADHAQARKYK